MATAELPRLAPIPPSAAAPPGAAQAPPRFPSHRDPGVSATLDPRAFALCEIVATAPVAEVEATLERSGIPPLPELVDPVIRLSYSRAAAVVRFFRWSGLSRRHRPSAWTLMIDLLGRNALFDAMWDAVRSAREEGALSPATFSSAFSSYCAAGRFRDAAMTFDVMDRYGVSKDAFAVNSLLAAVLREGGTASDAGDMFDRVKSSAAVDGDTFAILLEGWEREGNAARAKTTFGEMVIRVGWDAKNMSAFDAFLNTLVGAGEADEAVKFLRVMQSKGCLPGLKFFTNALGNLVKQGDAKHALEFWQIMVEGAGLVPNLAMYNAVITLLCSQGDADNALRLLDEMPFNGVFPDSHTYNTIFDCLLRTKKVHEADRFLVEMRKNEFPPTPSNCAAAVWMFFDRYDPEAAAEVWRCAVEDRIWPLDECANQLLVGLRELGRVSDARRYAEEILDMGIAITEETMAKLKSGFEKARKEDVYERLERRWKKGKRH
ncbi:hypothetical protein Taro_001714 [Colocasia esculenta]|uniref:Pentatricopeptide repeat-containing protein n=1 Tax=Colocasia esculenta TaxID=4460 RepID=A0A843TGK8_COLES|nr:hypothetical protein [Colocasia esculenta]